MRNVVTAVFGLFFGIHIAAQGQAPVTPSQMAYSKDAWQEDFLTLTRHLERRYANLAWYAAGRGGAKLPALREAAVRAIDQASSDEAAQTAVRVFVDAFHDGHLQVLKARSPSPPAQTAGSPPSWVPGLDDPVLDACTALNLRPLNAHDFMIPAADLPGTSQDLTGDNVFRSVLLKLPDGRRIGLPQAIAANPPCFSAGNPLPRAVHFNGRSQGSSHFICPRSRPSA